MGNDELPSNIGFMEISAPIGTFDFTLSASDITNIYDGEVSFEKPSHHDYSVNVVSLPVIPGYFQDVALISVLDEGNLINPHRLGESTQFTATSFGVNISSNVNYFDFGKATSVISGDVKGGGDINVSISDIGTTIAQIYMSQQNTESSSIRVLVPAFTYIMEPFPAYVFSVDPAGVF